MPRSLENLTYTNLIEDYSQISERRKLAAEATALRTQSSEYRKILVYQATSGALSYDKFRELVLERNETLTSKIADPIHVGSIGRLALLQQFEARDREFGLACLQLASGLSPVDAKSVRFRKLLVEDAVLSGNYDAAKRRLDADPDLQREYYGYLYAEMQNPHFRPVEPQDDQVVSSGDEDEWLTNFNRPYKSYKLSPINLNNPGETAFDRLNVDVEINSHVYDEALVSVVITTFKPKRDELRASVLSLVNQTWRNLEIILVDDASGEDFDETFQEVVELDPERIRLVRCLENGGTYVARNIGYGHSTGVFVTGQDDDDWSHPQRIEDQVALLQQDESIPGCRVTAIRCDSNLARVRLGYKPLGPNASSLMIRRELFDAIGGFLPIRKAADTEFAKRLELWTSLSIVDVKKPLTIIRISKDSLSRDHFNVGWQHPARRQFKSSYGYWHSTASKSELVLDETQRPPIAVPRALSAFPEGYPTELDVVFAGDWRQYGGPQKSMMEEIKALKEAGYSVGVLHLEAPRFMSATVKPMCDPIQAWVNEGFVHEVLYDDPIHVKLLILRYPPILQFRPQQATSLDVDQLIVLANQAPSELDGNDIRYRVPDCHENAEFMFRCKPVWVPQGPLVRDAISGYLTAPALANFDMPGILSLEDWETERDGTRSILPVVGRHSRDNDMKWPDTSKVLRQLYPLDGKYDVRVLGGVSAPLRVLKRSTVPAGWTVYKTNEVTPIQFLRSLDFYVFYQHEQSIEAFGRAILEAIATGLVVILPKKFERVFGEAAVYREPGEVESTIHAYQNHPDLYRRQSENALSEVQKCFSYDAYQNMVSGILAQM